MFTHINVIPSKGASVQSPHVCVSREVQKTCYHCNFEWISPRLRQSAVEESFDVVLRIDSVSPYRCCVTLLMLFHYIDIVSPYRYLSRTHTHTHHNTGEINPKLSIGATSISGTYFTSQTSQQLRHCPSCVGHIDFSRVH
jgi:hypothetical protein